MSSPEGKYWVIQHSDGKRHILWGTDARDAGRRAGSTVEYPVRVAPVGRLKTWRINNAVERRRVRSIRYPDY